MHSVIDTLGKRLMCLHCVSLLLSPLCLTRVGVLFSAAMPDFALKRQRMSQSPSYARRTHEATKPLTCGAWWRLSHHAESPLMPMGNRIVAERPLSPHC